MNRCLLLVSAALILGGCTIKAGTPLGGGGGGAQQGTYEGGGGGGGAAPPPEGYACNEPGGDVPEDPTQAVAIPPAGTVQGCLSPRDTDTYVVTAPPDAGGTLITMVLTGSQRLAPRFKILNVNRKRILYNSGSRGTEIFGWVHIAPGSQVFIQVDQVHSDNEPYNLIMEAVNIPEATEPNDSWEATTPLAMGQTMQATMSQMANLPESKSDWYVLNAPQQGQATVTLDIGGEIAPRIKIYDANRKRIHYKSGSRGERLVFNAPIPRPGTYLVEVDSVHRVEAAGKGEPPRRFQVPYQLTISY